jgi:SHS2 domain-containing protein
MNSRESGFILLNHTADLGMLVMATDLKDLFKQACRAMTEIMVEAKPAVGVRPYRVSLKGQDLPELMVRWLSEILYLFEVEKKIVNHIEIGSLTPSHLEADLLLVDMNPEIHEVLCEIKAVTYHQIEVAEEDGGWQARIFFDL